MMNATIKSIKSIMLNVVMLSVVMLSVVMLSVVMASVLMLKMILSDNLKNSENPYPGLLLLDK